jgi:acetyltransferase-like isoleucine patch superfamily enzyme/glycosyltransferase involved in cell wall biosynthesis
MTKVLELMHFYSLDEIKEFIKKGGQYPLHHTWGYDQLDKKGFQVSCVEYNKKSLLNVIGLKLQIPNLQQQINCIKNKNDYDIIYAPFMQHTMFLSILKFLKFFDKPIIAIAHYAYVPNKHNILKRIKQHIIRTIYFNAIDRILFLNQTIYNKSKEYKKFSNRHSYIKHWGIDVDFFMNYVISQKYSPSSNYIFSTGKSNRDFDVLVKAFQSIPFDLRIATQLNVGISPNVKLTSNIFINTSIPLDLKLFIQFLPEYYQALAVAIPLKKEIDYFPAGITVLLEALAMGKPIITTQNKAYPFDVEKEKVGLNVGYGDVEGWKRATNYFINHPEETKKMGERGIQLCKTKYNYLKFSDEIANCIYTYISEKDINNRRHRGRDIRGHFWIRYKSYIRKIHLRITTLMMYVSCLLRGIEIGKNVRFCGILNFERKPYSTIKIGNDCLFNSSKDSVEIRLYNPCSFATLKENAQIIIGNNVGASSLTINAAKSVIIGNNVLIGANTIIIDSDIHNPNPYKRNTNDFPSSPVEIKDNVFIGFNCMILKGVTIGENSVIGANSVVINNIPPNAIAIGNPCKLVIIKDWNK